MSQNYDKQVLNWKKELEDTLNIEVTEVTTYLYIRTYMYVYSVCMYSDIMFKNKQF